MANIMCGAHLTIDLDGRVAMAVYYTALITALDDSTTFHARASRTSRRNCVMALHE